nr:MAG TPA: hypothetical protein [Caudoviricetes sp.]
MSLFLPPVVCSSLNCLYYSIVVSTSQVKK